MCERVVRAYVLRSTTHARLPSFDCRLMSSWAVVCDVWYLDTQTREPGESPSDFAKRVKASPTRAEWTLCALLW